MGGCCFGDIPFYKNKYKNSKNDFFFIKLS